MLRSKYLERRPRAGTANSIIATVTNSAPTPEFPRDVNVTGTGTSVHVPTRTRALTRALSRPTCTVPESGNGRARRLDIGYEKVRAIMKTRFQYVKDKGCNGVDPDNAAFNGSGFDLTADTQFNYFRLLAVIAHDVELSVGLKNYLAQVKEVSDAFHLVANEQCAQYKENKTLLSFIEKKKVVLGIEYKGCKASVCAAANKGTSFENMGVENKRYSCRASSAVRRSSAGR